MKPILFNTDMVRAILDGRKTVTRRVVEFKHGQNPKWTGYIPDGPVLYGSNNIPAAKAPYRIGEILYVRETWASAPDLFGEFPQYIYRADYSEKSLCMGEGTDETMTDFPACVKWHPSIHMPKEAARLFLRVTDVRVERLQAITVDDVRKEGLMRENVRPGGCACAWASEGCMDEPCNNREAYEWLCWATPFQRLWDSTIKPADRDQYGWSANPWVWVISFERISKKKAYELDG